jgi:hypothetical protein
MKSLLVKPVVQDHVEAARHRDDHLMQVFMGMGSAVGPPRNVVGVVDPLDLKRKMISYLDKLQVTTSILDLR